jgi:hypothetical protein
MGRFQAFQGSGVRETRIQETWSPRLAKSHNPEMRKGGTRRFSQDLYQRTKGPVDPSKGF